MQGLQLFLGSEESSVLQDKASVAGEKDAANIAPKKVVDSSKMRIHRSYPVGLSFARDLVS